MLYYAQGDALITRQEFLDSSKHALPTFYRELLIGGTPRSLDFSTGTLTPSSAIRGYRTEPKGDVVPWQAIGPGKPLTVQVWEIYTGVHPRDPWFGRGKDMLVTSAVKSIAAYDAKPQALNFLVGNVKPKNKMKRPRATEEGTPFAFYSPALLDNSLTLDLSFVFDKFRPEIFEAISKAFTAAAGIPIFMPHSAYLLAGGIVAHLVGQAGEALFDGQPSFSASEPLDINWPGSPPLAAGFMLLTQGDVDAVDSNFRTVYHVNEQGQVVDDAGDQYSGDIPYAVISVDGTPHTELESWAPAAVSATLLSRFLHVKDGQSQAMDVLLDAVKLYNDFSFRRQVEQLDREIETTADETQKQQLLEKRGALVKNIHNLGLRPK